MKAFLLDNLSVFGHTAPWVHYWSSDSQASEGETLSEKGPPDMCHCSMSNRGGVREREMEIEIERDSEEEKGSAAPVQA